MAQLSLSLTDIVILKRPKDAIRIFQTTMHFRIIVVFILIVLVGKSHNPSIIFKENKGQWPEKVLFGTEFLNTKFYVNKTGFSYCIYNWPDLEAAHEYVHSLGQENQRAAPVINGHNYEVVFENADLSNISRVDVQPEYYNYFLGNKKSSWASNVHAYQTLIFNEVNYKTNIKLYSTSTDLKYDVIIKPGGDPGSFKMKYKNVEGVFIENGALKIKTSVGTIVEQKPVAYQTINGKQIFVECSYFMLDDQSVGFIFPEGYDSNHELIIDPTVVVCSYSSATGNTTGSACTYDLAGNIYNSGSGAAGYPVTAGAFQMTFKGLSDIVISRYNSTGTAKLFSTYVGGDSLDYAIQMKVEKGEIIVSGFSDSKNFPFSAGAFDTTLNGRSDIILFKLSETGDSLNASTCIGGSNHESSWYVLSQGPTPFENYRNMEFTTDTTGSVYFTGITTSTNFPVTPGAFSSSMTGISEAIVFKMDRNLGNLVWSTFLGGNREEVGKSIKTDGSGGVYVLGTTTSTTFPTTAGVISPTKQGHFILSDMFITHLNSSGSALIASTYIGTSANDYGSYLDIDANNNLYLCGHIATSSSLIPTPGLYSNSGGYNTLYKVNSSLSSIIFKTKFGNQPPPPTPIAPAVSPYIIYTAFRADSCSNIYVGGYAYNILPVTSNQIMPFAGGITDVYMAVFGNNCTSLKFASYFGGNKSQYQIGEHTDYSSCAFDNKGRFYMNLCTMGGLPTTTGAFTPTFSIPGDTIWNDAFMKVDLGTFVNANSSYGANITGCPPFTPTFVSTTNQGTTYWDLGNGVTSTLDTISTTYTSLGNYNVLLLVTDTNTCNRYDSIKSILSVINPTEFDLGEDIPTCFNTKALIQSNVTAVTYSWSTGQITPTIMAFPGSYTLTINNGGCNSSDSIHVIVAEKKLSERFPNVVTPNADGVNDLVELKKYNFAEVELIIYDRWGREVARFNDPNAEWRPDDLNPGTYFYVANYLSNCIGKYATDKGFITIFK